MTDAIRIKATDTQHRNVAYIYRRKGGTTFQCALANGIPASFSYAGVHDDQMGFSFALEDCDTAEDALIACERFGSRIYTYEIA